MPAILDDDRPTWSTWLGEDGSDPSAAKALLRTVEGAQTLEPGIWQPA